MSATPHLLLLGGLAVLWNIIALFNDDLSFNIVAAIYLAAALHASVLREER